MTDDFDKTYWEHHWTPATENGNHGRPVNPHLQAETAHLQPGTALDAGCGTGTEALWLAEQGWRVTGADISGTALALAARRAEDAGFEKQIEWIETDVARWEPDRTWDLVVTNYAHPDTGPLAFYEHIAAWVAPGGTLVIVGHLDGSGHGHDHNHPDGASVTPAEITALFTGPLWHVETCHQETCTINPDHRARQLHDVIVRIRRTR